MSENLQRNKHFLNLLINTTQTQAKALLKILTKDQLECLVEIAYNLAPLQKFHYRQKKLLHFIAKPSVTNREKQQAIIKYSGILLNIFQEVRSDIFDQL